ncbi:MAG: zinc ribbon domain-containing protein [Blastocatellia bacterium]|nr:zinc ribbon domain-containing protein [Blastocatellia bacterium]
MYCPSCSTQAVEGAKFCKTCGMNLSVITQALNGGVVVSDPLRDREYKRARKQISDGIRGTAIGAAFLVAAGAALFLIKNNTPVYAISLALALFGIIQLFRSIGNIIDAKVGPKLLDPELQPRGTGNLATPQSLSSASVTSRPSQRLTPDPSVRPAHTRPVSLESSPDAPTPKSPLSSELPTRLGTGRVNREHSSSLKKLDQGDDLMSKLRN